MFYGGSKFRGKGREVTERKVGPGLLRVPCHHRWVEEVEKRLRKGLQGKPGPTLPR